MSYLEDQSKSAQNSIVIRKNLPHGDKLAVREAWTYLRGHEWRYSDSHGLQEKA